MEEQNFLGFGSMAVLTLEKDIIYVRKILEVEEEKSHPLVKNEKVVALEEMNGSNEGLVVGSLGGFLGGHGNLKLIVAKWCWSEALDSQR